MAHPPDTTCPRCGQSWGIHDGWPCDNCGWQPNMDPATVQGYRRVMGSYKYPSNKYAPEGTPL